MARRPRFHLVPALATLAALACPAVAGTVDDGHEDPPVRWAVAAGGDARLLLHERSPDKPHRGGRCERLVIESGTTPAAIRLETPIGPAAVIDELRASVWVRSERPDVRLSLRVRLAAGPGAAAVETLVAAAASRDAGRWELLEVSDVPRALARQLPALRLEHGAGVDAAAAVVTAVVLELPPGAGRHDLAIDDLRIEGLVGSAAAPRQDPLVRPAAAEAVVKDPPAGLARGVLEVDGRPFFPRSIDWNGEPLVTLAELGFNCVRLQTPATAEQLAAARAAGLWVICPPPPIPEIDPRDPESRPMLRNWDRVIAWDLGEGLSDADVEALAERGRRVRACDPRSGRPLIGGADSGLRNVSRHVDLLVARRTVLGTSLELVDWLEWLRQRPRLARPGTPFMTTLATEIDPTAARQAAALAGIGGRGLAIDPESLALATLSAVAGGVRGILYTSSRRIDADEPEARVRATAVRAANLRLAVLEPWAAAGRFASRAQTSSPEVQAFVIEAGRARVALAWRCVQGSQMVARRYEGADVPGPAAPLTILVPGMPEAHRAWELAPGGLRPARQQRVTGGVSVTLDSFTTQAVILLSGDPAVTAHVQGRLRELGPAELASARGLAATALATAADLLGRLPPEAFSGPPPIAATAMLGEANRLAAEGEALVATDPSAATLRLQSAAAIAGQFERRVWENGVKAEGSMVASPLSVSDTTLAEQWRFVAARGATAPQAELLSGGRMERLEDLAGGGWRHFARAEAGVRTAVEIARDQPASGAGYLRLRVAAGDPAEPPVVIETPPLWITTPPIVPPAGKLLEISARVWVPAPLTGSVDGLLVFDSLGGPSLAERVGRTPSWRRLVLHRIVPAEAAGEPVTVTFALTGLGEARVDEVSIRSLEVGAPGTPATLVSAPRGEGGFASPADLLAQPAPPPPTATPPAAAAWPGTNLGWPRILPFTGSPNDPPPGPGGGTIDPFKRARGTGSPSP